MANNQEKLKSKKLEQFVNYYLEEFDFSISNYQMMKNILSPQKRDLLILEKVLNERIYASTIKSFSKSEIQELSNYLSNKIESEKQKSFIWRLKSVGYTSAGGLTGSLLLFILKIHLLWLLPLSTLYLIYFYKKSQNFQKTELTYLCLNSWVTAYKRLK